MAAGSGRVMVGQEMKGTRGFKTFCFSCSAREEKISGLCQAISRFDEAGRETDTLHAYADIDDEAHEDHGEEDDDVEEEHCA